MAFVVGLLFVMAMWPIWTRESVGPPGGELPHMVEGGQEPIAGQFVGYSESSIVEQFGPPSTRWKGHYGAPPLVYRWKYPDAVTATYIRPSGTLYLSYCRERGRVVCFRSDWMPAGAVF